MNFPLIPKLLTFMNDPTKKSLLMVEMASVVDSGEPLVSAAYRLEGEGWSLRLMKFICVANFPNLQTVARQIIAGNQHVKQQHIAYGRAAVKPGFDYLSPLLNGNLKPPMEVVKAARLFSLQKVTQLQPDATTLDGLQVLPFVNSTGVGKLKTELPSYLAKVAGVSGEVLALSWWRLNTVTLSMLSSTAWQVLLIQPSSVACESLFPFKELIWQRVTCFTAGLY